jgi:hypothetical protein
MKPMISALKEMVNYEILSQPLFLHIAIRCQYYKTCS